MAPNAEMVFAGKPHAPASVREAEAVGIYGDARAKSVPDLVYFGKPVF